MNKKSIKRILEIRSLQTETVVELRAALVTLQTETRTLLVTDVTAAETKMVEVRNLQKKIVLMEEIEAEEKRSLEAQKGKKKDKKTEVDEAGEMRAVVKSIMGTEMTTEERATIKSVDNAAVIPKQFINQLQEIKKGFGSVKEYCDIIPVTKNEGTIPVVDLDQNTLPEVVEGDNIIDGTLVTTDLPFKCAKHGLIQTLTSELLDDAEIEIEGLVKKNFTEIVMVAENTKILKIVKDNAAVVTGAINYEDVTKTMDGALPSVRAGLACLTNVAGYVLLKNMKDVNKRSLDLVTEIGGKYYFNGKELIVVDDTLLPATALKAVYYVLNFKEAVKFMDRKAVTIARSVEAGFTTDTVKVRILERFAVVKGSVRSIKKIEFTI
ncbi:phage major capsid protein [Clostridium sp. CF012]|uniref:phage major capsid protein n=1 Tax=Clostridium sp. CF012 TaxID=2843319 RepID=UPI001C0D826E|nr:phage major capsid protein [Clostridium sp. CF012]MBU3145731.1 phage major capsid protein [Clostridium sp. CF012]